MSTETKRTIIITNKSEQEVARWLRGRAHREADEVVLLAFYQYGTGVLSGLLKPMITDSDGRRHSDDVRMGGYEGTAGADGVTLTFERRNFYDPDVFWQTVDDLIREMRNDGFEVRGWLEPNPPDPRKWGWPATFDWYYDYLEQIGRMTIQELADKLGYSRSWVAQNKGLYDNEHGTSTRSK
jgi:hypothetical protein